MTSSTTCDSTQALAALGYVHRTFSCYDLDDQAERSLLRTFQRFTADEVSEALEHFKAIAAHWPLPAQLEKFMTEQRDKRAAGARDRARKRNYGTPVDLSIPLPADLPAKVAQARTAAKVGAAQLAARPRPEPAPIVDRANPRIVPRDVYEAAQRKSPITNPKGTP